MNSVYWDARVKVELWPNASSLWLMYKLWFNGAVSVVCVCALEKNIKEKTLKIFSSVNNIRLVSQFRSNLVFKRHLVNLSILMTSTTMTGPAAWLRIMWYICQSSGIAHYVGTSVQVTPKRSPEFIYPPRIIIFCRFLFWASSVFAFRLRTSWSHAFRSI